MALLHPPDTLRPRLLTEAAHGGLKPSPTERLRRVLLHLSYSMALSHLLDTLLPQLLTEAAHGGLKPSPTGRLRRVLLHLSYSMALSHLLDTTPPSLLTTAACGGLRPAPNCRPRRALLHLSYSSAPLHADGAFVTHDPKQTSRIARWGSPTGDAMQLVCLLAALVAVSQILALFLPARLKVRMSFLAPRTQRWGPIGILGWQLLRGTPTHPARWSS